MFFRKKYDFVQLEYPYNNLGQLTKRFIPRNNRNPNTEGYYDTYREAVRENRQDWAQENLEATKRYIQSDKDSKASLAVMPNYNKRYEETRPYPKEVGGDIPVFKILNWIHWKLNGL
jgi:hypothetical protein